MRYLKKLTLALGAAALLFCATFGQVQACDSCSGSLGVSNLGVLPNFNRHFVGFRYRWASYTYPGVQNAQTQLYIHRAEFYGRFCLGKRIQLYAFAPFMVTQTPNAARIQLADFTLQANFTIINTLDSLRKVRHLLQGGLGVKLPTGNQKTTFASKAEIDTVSTVSYPTLRAGTGSFDFIFTALYRASVKKTGLNVETVFKYNLANAQGYRYGWQAGVTGAVFHAFYLYPSKSKPNRMVLQPYVGAVYEWAAQDAKNHILRTFSGGSALSAAVGIDVFYQKTAFGVRGLVPVSQNLSAGQLTLAAQLSANFLFFF